MKKTIFPLFVVGATLPTFAKNINPDTQITWNSNVVVEAAIAAGLNAFTTQNYDVYNEILSVLLDADTFSVIYATEICKEICSTHISEKICQKACEDFGNELVEENNRRTVLEAIDSGQPTSLFKELDGSCQFVG